MKIVARAISYLSHPLFIPIAGSGMYFLTTPKYNPIGLQGSVLLPLFILTVIIPIIAYFILRNIGVISGVFMPTLKERRYPLYIHITLLFIVILKVVPFPYVPELYYFFLGLIAAAMTALILLFLRQKVSQHLMGMGSLFVFLVCLSIHFETNSILAISLLVFSIGLVATSRLYLKAHSKTELIMGFFVGMLSQTIMLKFWL